MVAAPFGYIGLAISVLLTGGIGFGVWFLVKKMVGPQSNKRISGASAQPMLPAETTTNHETIAAVAEASPASPEKP